MEAFDGYSSSGSTDNTKYLVIKQNLESKLNEKIFHVSSKIELRNTLDINKTQYDFLLKNNYIDVKKYRYTIMQIPYWMINS